MPPERRKVQLNASRPAHSYPRKRALAACSTCRVRKIKCNNAKPVCSACGTSGTRCVYEDHEDLSKFDPASQLILGRLDEVLRKLDRPPGNDAITASCSTASAGRVPTQVVDHSISAEKSGVRLTIPAACIGPDTVLAWPVFGGRFEKGLFNKSVVCSSQETSHLPIYPVPSLDEYPEISWQLVESFLRHVHIKNPVLNINRIRGLAAEAVEHGGQSLGDFYCLLLIICALSCFAKPLEADDVDSGTPQQCLHHAHSTSLAQGYFRAAMRYLGLLRNDVVAVQCWFFSGVYQMYMLKPLDAWRYFSQASAILYTIFQRHDAIESCEYPDEMVALYWTCWKSENDLRAELSLPESVLSTIFLQKMYPSPPPRDYTYPAHYNADTAEQADDNMSDFSRLQESAWLYYHSDITLKRLESRVLDTLYQPDRPPWSIDDIPHLTKVTRDFESELGTWLASLPDRTQLGHEWDTAPKHELTFNMQARILELKSWLYRPFVYIAVHHTVEICPCSPPSPSSSTPTSPTTTTTVVAYVHKAIACSFHISQAKPIRHRHHGTWFALRMVLSNTLALLAVLKVQRGLLDYLADWREVVGDAAATMAYWEAEAQDVGCGAEVVRALLEEIEGRGGVAG